MSNALSAGRVRGVTKSNGALGRRPRTVGWEMSSLKPKCSCPSLGAALTLPRSLCSTFMPCAASSASSFLLSSSSHGRSSLARIRSPSTTRLGPPTTQRSAWPGSFADAGSPIKVERLACPSLNAVSSKASTSAVLMSLRRPLALKAMLRKRNCAASGSLPSFSFRSFHARWASNTSAADDRRMCSLVRQVRAAAGSVIEKNTKC